jgi:hypothetical protein
VFFFFSAFECYYFLIYCCFPSYWTLRKIAVCCLKTDVADFVFPVKHCSSTTVLLDECEFINTFFFSWRSYLVQRIKTRKSRNARNVKRTHSGCPLSALFVISHSNTVLSLKIKIAYIILEIFSYRWHSNLVLPKKRHNSVYFFNWNFL